MNRLFKYSAHSYSNLQHNAKHKFAQSHALCLYRENSIYSFIPKNACSTMRASLARANGCIRDENDIHWIHHNNHTFAADLPELVRADYTFVILRCPFARLASVYHDKIVSRGGLVTWNLQQLTDRKVDLDELTFADFAELMSKPAIRNGNIHWRPQVDFLVYEEYDDYFCLEDFDKARKTLKDRIGLELIDARPLTKHGISHLEQLDDADYSKTSAHEIYLMKREGKVPSARSLYDDKSIELVAKHFASDIELYSQIFGTENLMYQP